MRQATRGCGLKRAGRVHLELQYTPPSPAWVTCKTIVGTWLSLVERTLGVGEVASSNLVVPTISFCSCVLSSLQQNPFFYFELHTERLSLMPRRFGERRRHCELPGRIAFPRASVQDARMGAAESRPAITAVLKRRAGKRVIWTLSR